MLISNDAKRIVIIGAGPAGLTAAYLLSKRGVDVTVLEADPQYVGGISKTVNYKGFLFDIGGHRFFSKSRRVEDLWTELLPDDLLVRPRSSRINYDGKFFSYPLRPVEAFIKLGPIESILCLASFFYAKRFPIPNPQNFEDWVTNQFGKRLFRIFFKTYTEKVWGMDCKEISADWAAQRIKGLSLGTVIRNAIQPHRSVSRQQTVKSLIDSFRYPRRGPGMMWEAAARKITENGGRIYMGHPVTGLTFDPKSGIWSVRYRTVDGDSGTITGTDVISSAPLKELIEHISPPLTDAGLNAAGALRYRDFLVVALILRDRGVFNDNWIYIHDPSVKVGRVQNFKSWSPEMVPDPKFNCYGMEYFCFKGDGLWSSSDTDLIDMAKRELVQLGLARLEDITDGQVVRQQKAYPVYDSTYAANVDIVRAELELHYPGLHLVGRNGMHKYNNQDHAMMTAMLTAENILAGEQVYDVWRVNQDAEYHESQGDVLDDVESALAGGIRSVPTTVPKR